MRVRRELKEAGKAERPAVSVETRWIVTAPHRGPDTVSADIGVPADGLNELTYSVQLLGSTGEELALQ